MSLKRYYDFTKKYLQLKKYQITGEKKPITCMISVTHNCNSGCITCNFWQLRSKDELTLEEIKKIFSSPVMSNLKNIGITGGEPTLRPDLNEIIKAIHEITGVKPTLSTNGWMPKKVDTLLKENKDIIRNVGTSVDGLEKTHDKIRGLNGGFSRVKETVQVVKNHGLRPNIDTTISKGNYKELPEIIKEWKGYDHDFKVAQSSQYYYADNTSCNFELNNEEKKEFIEILEEIQPSVSINKPYSFFLKDWLKNRKRPVCHAARFEIYIDAHGIVQPCTHKPPIGNIREKSLEEIWYSQDTEKLRKVYRNCNDCYERCTTSDFWVSPFKWRAIALARKIKNKLGIQA